MTRKQSIDGETYAVALEIIHLRTTREAERMEDLLEELVDTHLHDVDHDIYVTVSRTTQAAGRRWVTDGSKALNV